MLCLAALHDARDGVAVSGSLTPHTLRPLPHRLDALLTARRPDEGEWRRGSAALDAAGDDGLAPLLESPHRPEPPPGAEPDRTVAQAPQAPVVAPGAPGTSQSPRPPLTQ